MSDAAPEGGKKKGGKLPIIIALVVILAGGGYFMLGKKDPGPKVEPEPELGSVMALGDKEIIVNLLEREYFLRVNISVQLDKNAELGHGGGEGGGHGGAAGPAPEELMLRQIAMERLSTLSISDITKPGFVPKLRILLAEDFNHAIHVEHEAEEAKKKPKKKPKKGEEEEVHHEEARIPRTGDIDKVSLDDVDSPGWDSDEGPILKVFFTEFATMRE